MGSLSAPVAGPLRAIQDTLATFQSDCAGLDRLVEDLFEELHRLRCELSNKAKLLNSQRQLLQEREALLLNQQAENEQISARLMRQETQMAETLARLGEIHERLLNAPQEPRNREGDSASAAGEQTARLLAELEQARAAVSRLGEVEEDRAALEAELQNVRQRAAELAEVVEAQRGEMQTERSRLSEDLKQVRRMLEGQSSGMMRPPAPAAPAAQEPAADASEERPDAVLDSVMAQFAKLQHDVAERRRKKRQAGG